jgi:tetratricopeptide (TPR) repeat protein
MKKPELANKYFQKALVLNPYHIHVLNNLASSFVLLKQDDSAIIYYEKAVSIAPNFDESWFNLTAIYFNRNEYNKAYESLKKVNLFTTDQRYKPFVKTIIRSLIIEQIAGNETLKGTQLPENEDWYFDLHKQLRNQNKSLENLIFDEHILSPNK